MLGDALFDFLEYAFIGVVPGVQSMCSYDLVPYMVNNVAYVQGQRR